jgi:hypothetical protein
VPTSVLLAVLTAAGLLALAPALVRRYDATERLVAERAQSTARVLDRTRRRRTVPISGRPLYASAPPTTTDDAVRVAESTVSELGQPVWLDVGKARPASTTPRVAASSPRVAAPAARTAPASVRKMPRLAQPARGSQSTAQPARKSGSARQPARKSQPAPRRSNRAQQSPAVYRRRRVLAGLILLNVIELIGVTTVSAGFWTGFAVTLMLLVGYVVHLRNSALAETRSRRVEAHRAALLAAEQAQIRESHLRRIAARREALRRAAAARAAAQRDAQRLSQRYVDYDPERGARVRGKSYETGRGYDERAAGF